MVIDDGTLWVRLSEVGDCPWLYIVIRNDDVKYHDDAETNNNKRRWYVERWYYKNTNGLLIT